MKLCCWKNLNRGSSKICLLEFQEVKKYKYIEIILSSQSRRTKCKELLKFIVQHGHSSIALFVKELERQKKTHILDMLSHDKQAEESLREAIIRRYRDIVDEIEPRSIKHMFMERQKSAKQDLDTICNYPTRRMRAISFLRFILKDTHFLCHLFMQSMELSGCSHVVQMLNEELETYKECPRLYISKLGVKRRIEIAGEFQLWFTEGQATLKSKVVHQPVMQNAEGNGINQTREKHTSNKFQFQRTMEWVDKHLDQRARWDVLSDEETNRADPYFDLPSLLLGIEDLGSDLDFQDPSNDLFDTDCKFDNDDMSVSPSNKSVIVTRHDEAYELSSLSTVTHRPMSTFGGQNTIDMLLDDGLTCDSVISQHTLNTTDYNLNYKTHVCRYPGNAKITRNDTDIDMIDYLNKALENVGDLTTQIPTFEKCNSDSSLSNSEKEDTEHSLEKFLVNLSENVESHMTQQYCLGNKLPKLESEAGDDHKDNFSRSKSNIVDTDEPNLVYFSDTLPKYEYKQRPEKSLTHSPIDHEEELNKSPCSILPLILKGISKETGVGEADNIKTSLDNGITTPCLDKSNEEPTKEGKTGISFYTTHFDEAEDLEMYKLPDDKISSPILFS